MDEEFIQVSVIRCQRCGDGHSNMEFTLLVNPADEWKYFAICPNTEQPVLLKITRDETESRCGSLEESLDGGS